jgi:hypothetical protein
LVIKIFFKYKSKLLIIIIILLGGSGGNILGGIAGGGIGIGIAGFSTAGLSTFFQIALTKPVFSGNRKPNIIDLICSCIALPFQLFAILLTIIALILILFSPIYLSGLNFFRNLIFILFLVFYGIFIFSLASGKKENFLQYPTTSLLFTNFDNSLNYATNIEIMPWSFSKPHFDTKVYYLDSPPKLSTKIYDIKISPIDVTFFTLAPISYFY